MVAEFNVMFGKSKLTECKRLVRRAIAIASRGKAYHRLAEWYFTASAVYYEEGLYEGSVRYINKALQLSVSLGLVSEISELLVRLAMNYQNMGLYGNAIRHVQQANKAAHHNIDTAKGGVRVLFNLDIKLAVNSKEVEVYKKAADRFIATFRGKPREGYYWYLVGLYHYKKEEMDMALNAFEKARKLYEESGLTDDAVRSGIKEAMVLTETGRFREAKHLNVHVNELRKRLESKNIEAEYWTQQLAYHYYARSQPRVIKHYLEKCEEAARDAREVPVLLTTDRMTFRARARLGDCQGARRIFKIHLRRIKKILSNMPDQEGASGFLNERDENLFLREYKIIAG
jgi:tetratricopeptide (TPR) repeat protein